MTDPDVTLYQLARAWSDSIDARTPTLRFPPFDRPGRSYGWCTGGDASTLDPAECSDVAWLLTVSRGSRPERIAERAAHRERARSLGSGRIVVGGADRIERGQPPDLD